MICQSWDLYEHFGAARAGEGGVLTGWSVRTPPTVSARRRRPAVLLLPGGGYEHVSAREAEPVALRFLARGWVPFALRYSVAPARFPVALREAAWAMRLIRREADGLEVDPGAVAAVGFSAGGHLCGLLATLFDAPEVRDIAPGPCLRPDGVGLCYPVAVSWGETHAPSFENLCGGDRALAERLSLDRLVRPDMPPVCLWTTRDDQSVPCRNTLVLAQALDRAGVDFALRVYRHGRHGLATADVQALPAGEAGAGASFSPELRRWPEEMMDFFAAGGLVVRDGAD